MFCIENGFENFTVKIESYGDIYLYFVKLKTLRNI